MSTFISHRVYDFYSLFYGTLEIFFRRRVRHAIELLNLRPGQRVLDIGIGTGLSLDLYPPGVHVVGIDLSAGMLRRAAARIARASNPPKSGPAPWLVRGNALNLPFPPETFHAVFMSHVIATVPSPHRALEEAVRVTTPNGRLALVNHFQSPRVLTRSLEAAVDPICRRLGWRNDLSLQDLLLPFGILVPASQPSAFVSVVHLRKRGGDLYLPPPRPAPRFEPALRPLR